MKTLTATLLSAQKKPKRTPYVEAKVYDYEQGIKRLSWTRVYDGSTPWRTPTGHNDPEDAWTDEEKAYDDTDSTHATKQGLVAGQWTPFLELTHEDLWCNKVRFLLNNSDFDLVDVDVYYGSAWHDVYQGVYDVYPTWNEKTIPEGLKLVTKARLRARATITAEDHGCWFHELDFGVPAGLEPDNHHGIAFDGNGDMHRIRAGADNKLYYQKQDCPFGVSPEFPMTFPIHFGGPPTLDQWTQIATDCSGPCAIAAYGAKVYIFYRTSTNVLWKYYSHDYGETWNNAQLYALADALSLAACWKGATAVVVCFAATAIKISAIALDTGTQVATEYYYNHALDTAYGIGVTYQGGDFPIVLAGKDTDAGTGIVTYALYRTRLSSTNNFLALTMLLSAQEDVVTAFKYPDCHCPLSPVSYESIQLTAVEDYTGVTAYTRPLLAHLVKGTDWSSATITEPKFFADISSAYGLRLQTDSSYWWLSMPGGLWRAPRAAEPTLDLTPYIQQLQQVVTHEKPGSLAVVLDNSKGYFSSPGEGELASLRFRAEIALKLGYKTTAGTESVANLNYWVESWQYSSTPTQSLFTLYCLDLWGLANAWSARYSLRWNYTAFQPCRVWEILYQLLGRLGIRLWNNPAAPKSSAIDNYYPKFLSRGGTHGDTQLGRLLSFVTDKLVLQEALCFAKDLLSSEASSYEYKNQPGYHSIHEGAFADNLTITHTQVSGDTQDEPPVHVREAAFDWDLLGLGIDNLRMQYDANLEEADQAEKRADALLRHETLESLGDHIVVPTNVGQELYDVIEVTDPRCGIDQEKYRVLGIRTLYDRRKGTYEQKLSLGAP